MKVRQPPRRRRAYRPPQAAPASPKRSSLAARSAMQSFLAAEQMRGAFDVEEKTVGAVVLALHGEAVGV